MLTVPHAKVTMSNILSYNITSVSDAKIAYQNKLINSIAESYEQMQFEPEIQLTEKSNNLISKPEKSRPVLQWLCHACGKEFQFKCLVYKHQLYCSAFNRRKLKQQKHKKRLIRRKNLISKTREEEEDEEQIRMNVSDKLIARTRTETMFCSTCRKQFSSVQEYSVHHEKGMCNMKRFACSECGEKLTADEMKIHDHFCKVKLPSTSKKTSRESTSSYSCRGCNSEFSYPNLLKAHLLQNRYCAKIHHLSIKVEYFQKNKSALHSKTARKSFPGSQRVSPQEKHATKSPKVYREVEEVHREVGDVYKEVGDVYREAGDMYREIEEIMPSRPVSGSARKSFHNSSPRDKEKEHICNICDKWFTSFYKFNLHIETHHRNERSWMTNRCPQCYEAFTDSHQLSKHQARLDHYGRAAKSVVYRCSCPFCDKKFLNVENRNSHLRLHTDISPEKIKHFIWKTTCGICDKTFGSEILKSQHVNTVHLRATNPNSEKASDSDTEFQTYLGYSTKLKVFDKVPSSILEQLKKQPKHCPVCEKEYESSFLRNRHFRLHVLDGSYQCEYCSLKFPRAERKEMHVQLVHKEFLKFECKECGSRYPSRLRILHHVNKVHPEYQVSDLIQEVSVPSSVERNLVKKPRVENQSSSANGVLESKFYCNICELSFLKLCGLSRHNQSKLHNDLLQARKQAEKSLSTGSQHPPRSITPPVVDYSQTFTCTACFREFNDVHDFIPHRLSHFSKENSELSNDVIPYTCEVCGRLMTNYQKIQLHLFWHLQDVQSQTNDSLQEVKAQPSRQASRARKGSSSPLASAYKSVRSASQKEVVGQAVAKKSFNKVENQELVIGGIKTPLFTCKRCDIGFTSKSNYILHVRKFCRGQPKNSLGTGISDKNKPIIVPKKKSKLSCSKCNASFDGTKALLDHKHICDISKDGNTCCSKCKCLFSSLKSYNEHKTLFCKSMKFEVDVDEKTLNKNSDVLKTIMTMDSDIMACVQCKGMFSSIQKLSEHMKIHKKESGDQDNSDSMNINDAGNSSESDTSEEVSHNDRGIKHFSFSDFALNELSLDEEFTENSSFQISKSIINDSDVSRASTLFDAMQYNQDDENFDSRDSDMVNHLKITKLRNDFSRLLTVLVSDTDLMKRLGFGQRPIDEVLVNVLEKMSLSPIKGNCSDSASELNNLRHNIKTLLDVCIKDQIMDLIADREATTEEIVAAALKMFGVDS